MQVRVIARTGNPLGLPECDMETVPQHVIALLNKLFFEGAVDLGGLVEVDGVRYVCTQQGWGEVLK